MKDKVILKAAKKSNTKSLGSAIAHEITKSDNNDVEVRAIGVQAVNQAVKAIGIAGGFLGQQGGVINCRVGFIEVDVEDDGKMKKITGIKFSLSTER